MKAATSIVVERPIEDVWAFVANIENMDKWVVGVTEPRLSNGRAIGLGATYTSKYTHAGKTHTVDYAVTAFEPPRHFATRSTEGPFPFEGELDLERAGQGTKVTNTIDAGSDSLFTTITFTLLGPLVRIMMRRQLHKELVTLKSVLEAG